MSRDRRSRDQKRKLKLERKTTRRGKEPEVLPYLGSKYRRLDLAWAYRATETAIREAFVADDRRMTDRDVRAAFEDIVRSLRRGESPRAVNPDTVEDIEADRAGFLAGVVGWHWEESGVRASREDLAGVVRTLLAEMEAREEYSSDPRAFLWRVESGPLRLGLMPASAPSAPAAPGSGAASSGTGSAATPWIRS